MNRWILILTVFLLTFSGALLHWRIHIAPEQKQAAQIHEHGHDAGESGFDFHGLSFYLTLIDLVVAVPLLCFRRTAAFGYLLRGLFVIFGVIFMTHLSVVELAAKHLSLSGWILNSTISDSLIAIASLLITGYIYRYTFEPRTVS
jgi:hypothetical protein